MTGAGELLGTVGLTWALAGTAALAEFGDIEYQDFFGSGAL